jgi:hypothetical protein
LAAVTDGSQKLEVLRQHRQIFMTKKESRRGVTGDDDDDDDG